MVSPNPPQMFKVLLRDAKTGGKKLLLPCERTAEEVKRLRESYELVEAVPVFHEPNDDSDEKVYRDAITALVRAYRMARRKGDLGLAGRAEEAMAALLGGEKEPPTMRSSTLRGVQPKARNGSEDETQ
jgi:hypothetical protein